MGYSLSCSACEAEFGPEQALYQCAECGARLEIGYDLSQLTTADRGMVVKSGGPGVWRYRSLLPATKSTPQFSLGEGSTPLLPANKLGQAVGLPDLYLKNEAINPSGTFKDRCMAVGVAKALEFGARALAIASAGNAGAAAATYAARAGLPCYVFVPAITPPERITQILVHGAQAIAVKGTVNDCIDMMNRGRVEFGWHLLTTAAPINPYQGEGPKTIAYEICEQSGWAVPNWVILPVGGGGILSACWKGFQEFHRLGWIERLPRLVGVQAEGCAPLIRAFEEGRGPEEIESWGPPTTLAASIADPFPLDGATALPAIRASGGVAVAVSDEEILQAEELLARKEGVFAEPASSATLAALQKLLAKGTIGREESVVLVITGTGFKDMTTAIRLTGSFPTIEPRFEQMAEAVRSHADR